MSKRLTSRDDILEGAYALARRYGLSAISIRGVARECGISTGTVYNYFPSRDELVAAAAAELFSEAFYQEFCHPRPDESYLAYCERLFESLDERLSHTGADWLTQLQGLESGAREASRSRMNDLLQHMLKGLEHVLENDPAVVRDALTGDLETARVAKLTLDGIFDTVRRGEHDCRTLLALIERALY